MQNKHCNGSNLRGYETSILHYPPILPIVYYEGTDKWAAGMQLRDRVLTEEGVEDYIPNFSYKLVGIRDYGSEAEKVKHRDL